jgi:hypothetical protein
LGCCWGWLGGGGLDATTFGGAAAGLATGAAGRLGAAAGTATGGAEAGASTLGAGLTCAAACFATGAGCTLFRGAEFGGEFGAGFTAGVVRTSAASPLAVGTCETAAGRWV